MSTAGSNPVLAFKFQRNKCVFPAHSKRLNIVGILCHRELACSVSDCQGWNFEFYVWRVRSSHLSHHPQEVLLAQFSLHVHKGDPKPIHVYWSVNICTIAGILWSLVKPPVVSDQWRSDWRMVWMPSLKWWWTSRSCSGNFTFRMKVLLYAHFCGKIYVPKLGRR